MTNWYSIFYWLTVSDGIKSALNPLIIIFSFVSAISLVGYFISSGYLASELNSGYKNERDAASWGVWVRTWKNTFFTGIFILLLSTFAYVLIPSKKDALIIIAGGTVGNFVTQDSSARKIPAEVMNLLRVKIKEEINETTIREAIEGQTDTLKNKSKAELLEILKSKK